MKVTFLKFRIALFCAVLVLFVSVFANRLTLAKGQFVPIQSHLAENLPAEFVFSTNLSGMAKDIFQKINYERKRKKLEPLMWDEKLGKLAKDYSETMAEEGFFDHIDNDGNSVAERAENNKIKGWTKIGENLFQCWGYEKPAETAVKGWLKSPSHRDNIYDVDWTHTGIGVYQTDDGEYFMTQVFMTK